MVWFKAISMPPLKTPPLKLVAQALVFMKDNAQNTLIKFLSILEHCA